MADLTIARAIRRTCARASFVTVLPAVAFLLGFVLSAGFTVAHLVHARILHAQMADAQAKAIIHVLSGPIVQKDTAALQSMLDTIAPGRALVTLPTEVIISQGATNLAETARTYEIQSGGRRIATLQLAPAVPFQLFAPLPVLFGLCLLVSLIAAVCMRYFAKLAATYLDRVNRYVGQYTLENMSSLQQPQIMFKEFRGLNFSALRTTRRLSREIRMLRARAEIDQRTGLPNQFQLQKRLQRTLEQSTFERPSSLCLFEIDELESLTVKHHSDVIENLYVAIAERLTRTVAEVERASGQVKGAWSVASLPSNMFVVLVTGLIARDELAALVRAVRGAFRAPFANGDLTVTVTLSGSILMLPEDADAPRVAMHRAEETLKNLRSTDGTGFRFYSPKLERQREARLKLESELRLAVESDSFVPVFQPKIDLRTGRMCGVEALARWQLPGGRLVSPMVFIALAEEIGLIDAIGKQVLHKACVEAAKWTRLGYPLKLAVNVSPRQFEKDGLGAMILDGLAKSGLSPRQLELEITESLAVEQPERVRAVLNPLRKTGIQLAVDDFGTGHSNLAVLTQLDFDVFKIDRQFVSGIPNDESATAIVDLMLGMATTLGMQIVGEGIETPQQAEYLARAGCHIGQGFLYSPPVSSAEIFKLLIAAEPEAKLRA